MDSEASLPGSILAGDPWFLEGFKIGRQATQREVASSVVVYIVYLEVDAGCYTNESGGRLGSQRGIWKSAFGSQPGITGIVI